MSKEKPTELEIGIHVHIDDDNLDKLKKKPGYLSREAYPDLYKEIALEDEVGRFLIFRFINK